MKISIHKRSKRNQFYRQNSFTRLLYQSDCSKASAFISSANLAHFGLKTPVILTLKSFSKETVDFWQVIPAEPKEQYFSLLDSWHKSLLLSIIRLSHTNTFNCELISMHVNCGSETIESYLFVLSRCYPLWFGSQFPSYFYWFSRHEISLLAAVCGKLYIVKSSFYFFLKFTVYVHTALPSLTSKFYFHASFLL